MDDSVMIHLSWLAIPAATVLDLLLGDPRGWPHPVRWMGKTIELFEPLCRRVFERERLAGAVFASTLILSSWVVTRMALRVLFDFHPIAAFLAETVLIYYCLSIKSLMDAAMEIHGLLRRGKIDKARKRLAWIVSRDVDRYQGDDIARATVETVAENFVDGVVSPLFFAAIGGAPLAVAFKMVNTLDSMVGYKNERYRQFGAFAARVDDVANYLPARLAVPMVALAARWLPGTDGRRAFKTAVVEGDQHASPNAGYPEASFAGALGVRLNGPNYYHGRLVSKPYIGVAFAPVGLAHIESACRLMFVASLLAATALWLFQALLP